MTPPCRVTAWIVMDCVSFMLKRSPRSEENLQLRKLQIRNACAAAVEALGTDADHAAFVLMGASKHINLGHW